MVFNFFFVFRNFKLPFEIKLIFYIRSAIRRGYLQNSVPLAIAAKWHDSNGETVSVSLLGHSKIHRFAVINGLHIII